MKFLVNGLNYWYIYVLAVVVLSCSSTSKESQQTQQARELNEKEQEQKLDQASKDSEPSLLESFDTLANLEETLDDLSNETSTDDNSGSIEIDNSAIIASKILDDDPLVKFDVDDDVSAEYSEPVMVTGVNLYLGANSSDSDECKGKSYNSNVPTMRSVFNSAKKQNICGPTSISMCIRMSVASIKDSDKVYLYRKLPVFKVPFPCPGDSFVDTLVEAQTVTTDGSRVGIQISARKVVEEVQISNSSSCEDDGNWNSLAAFNPNTPVSWSGNGTSEIAIKFRDQYGYESDCIKQTVVRTSLEVGTLTPGATSTSTSTSTSSSVATSTTTDTDDSSLCQLDVGHVDAEDIKNGITIGGITGTGALPYPVCTTDGQTNCIASASFKGKDVSSLTSAEIVNGTTVGGVSGSKAVENRSDCSADGEVSCITNSSFKAVQITSLASKVVENQTVAGVAGSAVAVKENCSVDGEISCGVSSPYKAADSVGLAAKVVLGQNVAGVAGTTLEAGSYSNCSGPAQSGCIVTSPYKTLDLSQADSGGALDLLSSNFNSRMSSASIFEYWDEAGVRHTNSGDSDLVVTNIMTGTEIFGLDGTAKPPPDCDSIGTPGTWVLVPGDEDYGTNDFCVMKYEAKNDGSGVPESEAAGTPWGSITQLDAVTACASIGKGYRLITNDEWMTIASNIAAQGGNWDGGVVGTNELTRGHSDGNPTLHCPADGDDNNAYLDTDCSGRSSTGTFNQRRTFYLSTGSIIWDFAGNSWE